MSDLLNIVMEDPKVKEEMISRAKKAIKDITFTKKDMARIKTAMVDTIIETCGLDADGDDSYYEIQSRFWTNYCHYLKCYNGFLFN